MIVPFHRLVAGGRAAGLLQIAPPFLNSFHHGAGGQWWKTPPASSEETMKLSFQLPFSVASGCMALAIAGCGATVIIDPWVRFPPPEAHFTVTVQAAATMPATQPGEKP